MSRSLHGKLTRAERQALNNRIPQVENLLGLINGLPLSGNLDEWAFSPDESGAADNLFGSLSRTKAGHFGQPSKAQRFQLLSNAKLVITQLIINAPGTVFVLVPALQLWGV